MNKAEKINYVTSNINLLETPVSKSTIKSANVADLDKWVEEITLKLSSEEEDNEEEDNAGVSNDTLEVQTLAVQTERGVANVKVAFLKFIKISDSGNLLFQYNNKTLTAPIRLAITDPISFEREHKGTFFPIKFDSIKPIISTKRVYDNLVQGQILESECEQLADLREQARLKSLEEQAKRQQIKALTLGKTQEEKELIRNYSTLVGAKSGLESLGLDVDPALLAMIIKK